MRMELRRCLFVELVESGVEVRFWRCCRSHGWIPRRGWWWVSFLLSLGARGGGEGVELVESDGGYSLRGGWHIGA